MFRRPILQDHIARLSIMAITGLLVTYAFGIYTSGTMMIYCAFLELYCQTIKAARETVKRRLRIQFVGVPVIALTQWLLSLIPGIPVLIRLTIGAALCVPLLLSLNYKFKLGFTEISQLVIVALITATFESNRLYFAYRLFLTTLGILLSYVFFVWLFPVRYDIAYDEKSKEFRKCMYSIGEAVFQGKESLSPDSVELTEAGRLKSECTAYLDIIKEDIHLKKQYRKYRNKLDFLLWEHKLLSALLEFITCRSQLSEYAEFSEYAFSYAAAIWQKYRQLSDDSGEMWPDSLHQEPVDYSLVITRTDLELAQKLAALHDAAANIPRQENPDPVPQEFQPDYGMEYSN